ncbi:MAG: twin-arginine translocation signal domain-containing protein, partial [Pseudomonadota bacterium]|nr:twin-arginine translocation signal domain-containing protein [Pseudomonadota bacterium]
MEVKRRDFLYIATGAVAAVGAAATAWPMIDQMNPAADVLAAGGPLTV